ncbi:hypothetical protein F4802DRAFT_5821 [Xylaria palmicola]|nr:hypothetical protein F4802DRAFT_5821 [Xylaria palmicola]
MYDFTAVHASCKASWRSAYTGEPTRGAMKSRHLWYRAPETAAIGTGGGRRRRSRGVAVYTRARIDTCSTIYSVVSIHYVWASAVRYG